MNGAAGIVVRQLIPHLAAFAVIGLCVKLAFWQADQAQYKRALIDSWADAPAVSLDAISDNGGERYTRVSAHGRFDPNRHVLLDNQSHNFHAGVHVFTPFSPEGSERIWLVNRGWHPLERRDSALPPIETADITVSIHGRLSDPPRVGVQIGRAAPLDPEQWPNLMTYFDLDRIRSVLGEQVQDKVILLDPSHPAHLTGDPWQPVILGPERHRGYVFQWASIALAVFIIWLVLTIRSFRRS